MDRPVVLFDGVCNFCNGSVNFLIRQDKSARLRFSPLQSNYSKQLLEQFGMNAENLDSFVVVDGGKLFARSAAALRVLKYLRWYWWPLRLLRLVPRFMRDGVYDFVAKRRYGWFGKREECVVPTSDIRSRFL